MKRIIPCLAAMLTVGCVFKAPQGKYRIQAAEVKTTPYGAWSKVQTQDAAYQGELLAVDPNFLYLLTNNGATNTCLPIREIRRVRIAQYNGNVEGMTMAYVGGAVATVPLHGFISILTMPVWLITGGAIAAISNGSIVRPSGGMFANKTIDWSEVTPWARFPAGPPKKVQQSCRPPMPQGESIR